MNNSAQLLGIDSNVLVRAVADTALNPMHSLGVCMFFSITMNLLQSSYVPHVGCMQIRILIDVS
jgi:hypothetical protein